MSKYGFSFSWKRLLGITGAKQHIARKTGIPTTKQGAQNKVGATLLNLFFKRLFKK